MPTVLSLKVNLKKAMCISSLQLCNSPSAMQFENLKHSLAVQLHKETIKCKRATTNERERSKTAAQYKYAQRTEN